MTLPDLIAKLEQAEGPSRELDAEIRAMLFAGDDAYAAKSPFNGEWCVYKGVDRNGREKLHENRTVPHALWNGEYTASIDAAVALVNRVLPDAFWIVSRGRLRLEEPLYAAQILFGVDEILGEAEGNSLPIVIVLAILRALSSKEQQQ